MALGGSSGGKRGGFFWCKRHASKVVVDVAGIYVVRLNLFNGGDLAATDPLYATTVESSAENLTLYPPIVLDGTGSFDVDGDVLGYEWNVVAAPAAGALVIADAAAPFDSDHIRPTGPV